MGFFVAFAFIVCLASVSRAAPLSCEDLVRPLDQMDPHHIKGRWALVAGSLSRLPDLERFKQMESASMNVANISSENRVSYTRSFRFNSTCAHVSFNVTLEGGTFTYAGFDKSNLSANFFHTSCHDCLLMLINEHSGKVLRYLLVSRRRQLEQKELDEFTAQVKCLNMPPPVFKDPAIELCPAETTSDPEAAKEEKTGGQEN